MAFLAATWLLATGGAVLADPVPVTGGLVRGEATADGALRIFRGIPFAAPPVGELRWRAPQPVIPWEGVRDATRWGDRCMQGDMFGGPLVSRETSMSEDCLYLNVWTPAKTAGEALPVFFVIHGGGFAAGSGSEPRTDGEWFARQGIVVVTINYRLALFGFLSHPELTAEGEGHGSGNYGLLDMVAALRWVRDNIEAFGGDPQRITVNGESAGSMATSALMASPLSRDLFQQAIGQSGAFFPGPGGMLATRTVAEKEADGVAFARSMEAGSIADLRKIDAKPLLDAVMAAGGWGYGPGLDGHFLPEPVADLYAAGSQATMPLIAGWTSSESGYEIAAVPALRTREVHAERLGNVFGDRAADAALLYPADDEATLGQSASDLAGDLFMGYPTWKWVEVHQQTSGAPTWRYRFDRALPEDPAGTYGAPHASDIEYAFNTLGSKGANWRAEDHALALLMATTFANFVKSGDPNGEGVPTWPAFTKDRQVMYFDAQSRVDEEPHRPRYELLDEVDRSRRADEP